MGKVTKLETSNEDYQKILLFVLARNGYRVWLEHSTKEGTRFKCGQGDLITEGTPTVHVCFERLDVPEEGSGGE